MHGDRVAPDLPATDWRLVTDRPPSTSVVVLNWNGGEMVSRCVASVLAQTPRPDDVLVVDNGSTDGSPAQLAARYPDVKQLALGRNSGFAGGMNAGIAATSGEALLLLNLDVELEPDYLARALAALAADPGLGGVTGKLLRFSEDRAVLDSTGHRLYRNRRAVDRGEQEPDEGQYDDRTEVFGVGGAAPLLRRSMLDDIRHRLPDRDSEYFDADFFAYFEDIDLCWRARTRGWRFGYVPSAVARHHRGGTGSRRLDWLEGGNHRNRLLMMVKDDALPSLLRHAGGILYTELRSAVHLGATRPKALLLAYAGLLRLLPRMLAKRREVQGRRTVGWRELEPWLEPYDYRAVLRRGAR